VGDTARRHQSRHRQRSPRRGQCRDIHLDGREFKATLNAQNLIEKVSYLSTNEVVGDYAIEMAYSDYADFGGVKFPRHIVQTEDGHPTLDITGQRRETNAAVTIAAPDNVREAAATAAPGGRREACRRRVVPQHAQRPHWASSSTIISWSSKHRQARARSLARSRKIKKAIPNKPIRYVINTHAHYSITPRALAPMWRRANVITHELNKPFFEKVWGGRVTIRT